MVSTFFNRSKTATITGYVYVFVTGILAATLMRAYFDSSDVTPPALLFVVCLVPPFAFFRGLSSLSRSVSYNLPGLKWGDTSNIEWQEFTASCTYLV